MEKENEKSMDAKKGIYEIGYLLVPTLAEEKVAEEVSKIKSEAESRGGIFISEDFPVLKALTYRMSKEIETRKQKFDQAYFGWVKFEIESSMIPEVKNALNANINILRSLVVKTVRENTMSYAKVSMKRTDQKTPEEEGKTEAEIKGPVNEEEIDKSIDKLVIS